MNLQRFVILPLLILILLVNIFILYQYYFVKKEQKAASFLSYKKRTENIRGLKIAYIQLNKIEEELLLSRAIKKQIANYIQHNENKLNFLLRNYQQKNKLLESKANKLSPQQIRLVKEELQNMKNVYLEMKNAQEQELKELQYNKVNEMREKIFTFLKKYSIENKIDVVFSDEETLIYYKNPVLDITQEVINNLNKTYSKKTP